mgnify:CR=1 FL=1
MTKKTIFAIALACISGLTAHAQLKGDGYYRIQNVKTGRYMTLCDRHSRGANSHSTQVDAGALQTKKLWSDIESDPGSVFYIKKVNGEEYNILAQGIDMHQLINYYVRITRTNDGQSYRFWQTNGTTLYLSDENTKNAGKDNSFVKTAGADTRDWKIIPLDNNGDNHLGLTPKVQANNGKYYTTYLAGFPFSLQSSGMKAYTITTVNESQGMVGYQEINGDVPANTPVVIECSSADGKNNLIQPLLSTSNNITGKNMLTGVYFNVGDWISGHYNYVEYNTEKQRLLSTNATGELVFNTSDASITSVRVVDDESYWVRVLPHNSAYIAATASTPTELKVVDNTTAGVSHITTDATKTGDIYTLTGIKVRSKATSTAGLPQGIYVFNGKKVVVE